MNIIKWVINKKKIEEEIEQQDRQYNDVLAQNGQLSILNTAYKERNDFLECEREKNLETIGKLRQQVNALKKGVKASETSTH